MREAKIHIVKRANVPFQAWGYHRPNTNDIYIARDKNNEKVKQHELYHHRKNHPDKPRNIGEWVDHEIEAELHAQAKTRVVSMYSLFNGWLDSLRDMYRIDFGNGLIGQRLKRYKVPDLWWKSYRRVVGDVHQAMRKTNPY